MIDRKKGTQYVYGYDAEGCVKNVWACGLTDTGDLVSILSESVDYNDESQISAHHRSIALILPIVFGVSFGSILVCYWCCMLFNKLVFAIG